MKRLLRLACLLYPPAWRRRYGDEFDALLDQLEPGAMNVVDVLRGGLFMRMRGFSVLGAIAGCAVMGGLAAGFLAGVFSQRPQSSFTLEFRPGEVAVAAPSVGGDSPLLAIARQALTNEYLASFSSANRQRPTPEVSADEMKANIDVELLSPNVLKVSYAARDDGNARDVTRQLQRHFVDTGFESARAGTIPSGTVWAAEDTEAPRTRRSLRTMVLMALLGSAAGALVGHGASRSRAAV